MAPEDVHCMIRGGAILTARGTLPTSQCASKLHPCNSATGLCVMTTASDQGRAAEDDRQQSGGLASMVA